MAKIEYGQIISQAKELTFKHKWLWVYGLALAIFGAGASSSFRFPNSSSSSKRLPENLPQQLPENVKNVLGATTSALKDWFMSIPASTWILFIIIFTASVCLSVIVGIIVQNWAKAALISATAKSITASNPLTLSETAPAGRKYMKNLFIFSLLNGLISTFIIAGLSVPLIFVYALNMPVAQILLSIIFIPIILVASLFLGFITTYGERLVVLHNFEPFAAWKRSWSLAKRHFAPSFIMSLTSGLVGCSLGCLASVAVVVLVLFFGSLIYLPNFLYHTQITPIQIGLSAIVLVLLANLNLIFAAALQVFNHQVWTIFVNQILADEKNL